MTRPTSARWIASCIRDHRSPFYCASESTCSDCSEIAGVRTTCEYVCSLTRADDSGGGNVGVAAYPTVNTDSPHRLGCVTSPCIWGVNQGAWVGLGATCCRAP